MLEKVKTKRLELLEEKDKTIKFVKFISMLLIEKQI